MLTYIDINKIKPHPDNPRKDLGDLTELADSIKANGILQNLTVVPWFSEHTRMPSEGLMDGHYRVVIGHRRHAAAKLAGLTEVPCKVVEMTPREQVATMLLENMQRNDLTIYEQAQGFQMMLNFGDTLDDISKATGFSKATVKHRVKLLELDQDKFKKAIERGGTIQDYIELEKIQNVKTRNKVLEHIGTSEFKWQLNQAIEEEERPIRKQALVAELNKFAKPVKNSNGLSYVQGFWNFKMDNFKKPADADKAEYFYVVDSTNIALYKKEAKAQPKKLTDEEKSYKEREARLKDLTRQAYESRRDFVMGFSAGKKYSKTIGAFVFDRLFTYSKAEIDDVLKLLALDKPEEADGDYFQTNSRKLIQSEFVESPEQVLLIAAYAHFGDNKTTGYVRYESWGNKITHTPDKKLDKVYDVLMELGYEMSDEEIQLRCGTHKLFDKEVSS